jgi:hypothetical protein
MREGWIGASERIEVIEDTSERIEVIEDTSEIIEDTSEIIEVICYSHTHAVQ